MVMSCTRLNATCHGGSARRSPCPDCQGLRKWDGSEACTQPGKAGETSVVLKNENLLKVKGLQVDGFKSRGSRTLPSTSIVAEDLRI